MKGAMQNWYEKAVLVSGDTDLVPVLKNIRELYRDKKLSLICPMGRVNRELISHSHTTHMISEEILKDSMFDNPILIPGKTRIECPSEWGVPLSSSSKP